MRLGPLSILPFNNRIGDILCHSSEFQYGPSYIESMNSCAFNSTVLGTNFSSISCPSFFATFLNSASFQACRPLSLLLGTSNGFFQAEKNASTILPYVIDQSCDVAPSCADTMAAYAIKLKQSNVCGPDLAAGNALATTAYNGFLNYQLYYEIGCQKSETTDNYCLAEAADSGTDQSSMYWWVCAKSEDYF
jgi:hypothetical protein